jgi:ribosomal protein S12 methylthiotransferase
MRLQETISTARLKRYKGEVIDVLVDEIADGRAIARSAADAPEIDGAVHIARAAGLAAGEFAKVRVTRTDAHDLFAVPVRTPNKI